MMTATMTTKGQITIPKSVRELLNIHSGDRIAFSMRGHDEAVMKPVTKTVDQVFGCLHESGRPAKTVAELNRVVAQRMRGERA